jgi:hypothetical protein
LCSDLFTSLELPLGEEEFVAYGSRQSLRGCNFPRRWEVCTEFTKNRPVFLGLGGNQAASGEACSEIREKRKKCLSENEGIATSICQQQQQMMLSKKNLTPASQKQGGPNGERR